MRGNTKTTLRMMINICLEVGIASSAASEPARARWAWLRLGLPYTGSLLAALFLRLLDVRVLVYVNFLVILAAGSSWKWIV
ncbi:hypothetical protein VNO77_18755 [Canavalia gladiata]|uniref:Uncharacterized protein n=1 Tax=Canavalia gladiata TaxID=3824 RepID=A0AAN9LLA6_CANGL